jgi:TatA/E family protein of Tat protein translocase
MFGLGTAEVVVILTIGLVLFGHKLPGVARMLGRTVVDFRKEMHGLTDNPFEGPAPGK